MDRTDRDVRPRRAAGKTRRRFLLALGTTSTVAVAGCNSNTDTTGTDTTPGEEPTGGEATGTPTSGGDTGGGGTPATAALSQEARETLQLATTTREQIQFSLSGER